ncbi:MAG: hypothetical protein C4K58_07475 [Flavobacteriaceae bacterium]|nr:MAG: hypothetical protein C4K58_07475 [Flavobacteriaceae bacterium]
MRCSAHQNGNPSPTNQKSRWKAQFVRTQGGNAYASELVEQIQKFNGGEFLHQKMENSSFDGFCIGVAGYPEKHLEAPSKKSDLENLKLKVDAGADYVVTQMFFDNQKYFDFVKSAREIGIDVPIIPGIKPLSIKKHLQVLPQIFSLDLPDQLISEVVKAKDNDAVREIGIQWAIQQSKELMAAGVPTLHYYSMGKSDNIYKIAKALF